MYEADSILGREVSFEGEDQTQERKDCAAVVEPDSRGDSDEATEKVTYGMKRSINGVSRRGMSRNFPVVAANTNLLGTRVDDLDGNSKPECVVSSEVRVLDVSEVCLSKEEGASVSGSNVCPSKEKGLRVSDSNVSVIMIGLLYPEEESRCRRESDLAS